MLDSILATKFYIPPKRVNSVGRPLLVEKLLAGLDQSGCFVLVSGPAGFGKTTLLSEFVFEVNCPAAWISLDESDNDLHRFWECVFAAIQNKIDIFDENDLELLENPEPGSLVNFPTLLIKALIAHEEPLVLILDDYNVIQSSSIHESLLFFIDHIPDNIYLVVASRSDPPWPLARYRAGNRLIEIRTNDLRFNFRESGEFLNQTMGLHLSLNEISALEEHTEGWIAGLQLAALSMQGRDDIAAFVKAFTGSHIYIAEYLLEEVLKLQSQEVQTFLFKTSLLSRLNADLCNTVTGRENSHSILNELHRDNIFLIPLDDEGKWFRYHHLFADLLNANLRKSHSTEEINALQQHAADWHAANGYQIEAIRYTFAAGDYEKAATYLDLAGQSMLFSDRYTLLKTWLDALPVEALRKHPRLEIYQVLIDLSLGKIDMFEQTLQEKEDLIKSLPYSPENDKLRLRAMVYLSAFIAHQNTSRAIEIAEQALEEIGEEDLILRAGLYATLYRAHGMNGDIQRSAPAYKEYFRLGLAAGILGQISNTTMVRAFDLCQYARLDEASDYCQKIIETIEKKKGEASYSAGPSYLGLGGIHLERNELEKAEKCLTKGLELCQQGAKYGLYTGYIQKARLLQAKGEFHEAVRTLEQMGQTIQRMDFTLTAQQVASKLSIGDLAGVADMEAPLLKILGESYYAQKLPLIAEEAFKLNLIRIYIATEEYEKAFDLLDEIQPTIEAGTRYGRLLEIHMLRARTKQGKAVQPIQPTVILLMEQALELAIPARIVNLFLEEGPPLIPLLQAVADHVDSPDRTRDYATKVLAAFRRQGNNSTSRTDIKTTDLVEPLTPREMEVLLLLAEGDSNQTIAEKLFITVRTVKKHTGNIYGKLNVNSRIQAVTRARELSLLPPV